MYYTERGFDYVHLEKNSWTVQCSVLYVDLKIYKLYRNAFVLVFIFDMIFNPKCTIKYQVSKLDATLHSPYDEQ